MAQLWACRETCTPTLHHQFFFSNISENPKIWIAVLLSFNYKERERWQCCSPSLVVLPWSGARFTSYKTRFTTLLQSLGFASLFAGFIILVKKSSFLDHIAIVSWFTSSLLRVAQTTLTVERKISAAAVKEELVWFRTHTNSLLGMQEENSRDWVLKPCCHCTWKELVERVSVRVNFKAVALSRVVGD